MARNKENRWATRAFTVVLLFCCLAGTLVTVIGAEMVYRGMVLHADGVRTEAEVTRVTTARRGRRSGNSRYVLYYRFRAPGSDRWYTHTDALTGKESRVGVSHAVWERAGQTNRIGVTYYPANPAINRPTDHTPLEGLWCPGVGTLFVALLTLGNWVGLVDEYKKLRGNADHKSAPPAPFPNTPAPPSAGAEAAHTPSPDSNRSHLC